MLGGYYLNEEMDYAFLWKEFFDLVDNSPDPNGIRRNDWATWQSQLQMSTTSYAAYYQLDYEVIKNHNIIFGGRHTRDERTWDIVGQNPNNLTAIDFTETSVSDVEFSWDAITWKVGTKHHWLKSSMMYTSISTGFMGGNYKRLESKYDEQHIVAYEVGNKSMWLDKSILFNTSVYYDKYSDLLATNFIDINGTTQGEVNNAGAIDAMGIEFELSWRLSDSLQLGMLGELSNTEYGDFIVSNPYEEGGETINGVSNLYQLSDSQVAYSPDYAVTLLGNYVFKLADIGDISTAIYTHVSGSYRTTDEPYAYAVQNRFFTTDIHIGWRSSNRQWGIKGFIRNLTNEAVLTRATRFGGNVAVVDYADPRLVGMQIEYSGF